MEYKKNSQRNPSLSSTSHFTETNAGHISVKTTSPFLNTIKDSEYKVSEQNQCKIFGKCKKNLSTIIMNKILRKDASAGTSQLLINQILAENQDPEALINLNKSHTEKSLNIEKQSNYNQHFFVSNINYKYSTPTFNSSSRQDSIVPNRTNEAGRNIQYGINNAGHYKHRPSINYNQEFINKTVERNNRLQKLVKKLILIRKEEKRTEAWNNYINELKSKHKYYDTEFNRITGRHTYEEPLPLEYIDDYYENQSNPCKDLLKDFYDVYDTIEFNPRPTGLDPQNPQHNKQSPHQNDRTYLKHSHYCYPISSQGRLMMLDGERSRYLYENDSVRRPMYRNTIVMDRKPTRVKSSYNKYPSKKNMVSNKKNHFASIDCSVQTDDLASCIWNLQTQKKDFKQEETNTEDLTKTSTSKVYPCEDPQTIKGNYSRVCENVDTLTQRNNELYSIDRQIVLENIEKKLDSLMTSINSFIDEVKSRPYAGKYYDCRSACLDRPTSYNKKMNITKSGTIGLNTPENLVCEVITEKYSTPLSSRFDILTENSCKTNIHKILLEEMDSSKRTKDDIDNMLKGVVGVPCSAQISIDIPTRDRTTEVTDSLEKAVPKPEVLENNTSMFIEEVDRSVGERYATNMTIAVNTDPLGLLALLNVSRETVKQLLSYVPNIPYHSFILSMFPQTRDAHHYVCNICGAAFGRPSQLSDHLESHDLTKTRACCVCRHILDMQRHHHPGLFRCQYCGQRFTRAYCCELHQESCARRFGTHHDVTSSRMILT